MVKPRENRVPIMFSEDELAKIDDWRFQSRIATRADAIRRLCHLGITLNRALPYLDTVIQDTVIASVELQRLADRAKQTGDMDELADHATESSFSAIALLSVFSILSEVVSDIRVSKDVEQTIQQIEKAMPEGNMQRAIDASRQVNYRLKESMAVHLASYLKEKVSPAADDDVISVEETAKIIRDVLERSDKDEDGAGRA